MGKNKFFAKLGLCVLSAVLGAAAFASCADSDSGKDISNNDQSGGKTNVEESISETMTKEAFFAELEKREEISIAAKKWDTVNVKGTVTKNGVSVNVNMQNAKIHHSEEVRDSKDLSYVDIVYDGGAIGGFPGGISIFRLSEVLKELLDDKYSVKFEKINTQLKLTSNTEDSWGETIIGNDGYITYCKSTYIIGNDLVEMELSLSGFSGKYSIVKAMAVNSFIEKLTELQNKAPKYTAVMCGGNELTIVDGYIKIHEDNTQKSLLIGADGMQKRIARAENEKTKIEAAREDGAYTLKIYGELTEIYVFNNDGYLQNYMELFNGKTVRSIVLSDYRE